jgi:crotonobetainyl-CoA:carnitine CoA-transferase CaiB-like acyl-CoA transferase
MTKMFEPLKGVRVIDLSQVLAGPFATYQLGLMGAEVIKVEKPDGGDWTRIGDWVPELAEKKMGMAYIVQNSNKKSVTIDLKTKAGLAVIQRLIATADVFVENFKPGVAARLGLSFEEVAKINPRIVYCSVSAFGQDGQFSDRPAYDHIIQGMCGIMLTTGEPGSGPTKVGSPYVDYATGMNAGMAILAGLLEARRTEAAVQLDVAMLDTALMLMVALMSRTLSTDWKPEPSGNEAWSASPSSGAFDTAKGTLMLAANNAPQFKRLCAAIGRDDILQDARWATNQARKENASALRETLEETFLTRPATEWEDLLSAASIPAGRVRSLDEILSEDHIAARGLTSQLEIAEYDRPIHIPAMSFKANGQNHPNTRKPSQLGADTDEVLSAAGFSDEEILALHNAGVLNA